MLPEPLDSPSVPLDVPAAPTHRLSTMRALFEVVICSGYATQLVIIAGLSALGLRPGTDGTLSPAFIFALSAADTVLLLGLVFLFLRASGDRARDIFLGARRLPEEIRLGILLVPIILMTVFAAQIVIRLTAPSLRNVEVSPFAAFLASPWLVAGFIVLVLVAGGVREELQRAFLLHRFEQRLGGARLGVVVTSVAFGLGHTVQGWDAAIVTGLMGAFWGVLYLARRSVVATVTNHALFNVAQILIGYAALTRA